MNPYEMTFIVRPDLDEEQTRAAVDSVTGRITAQGGELIATYLWNPPRRRLAFPIKDFSDGFYVTTVFRFPKEGLTEFERGLRLNTGVLRFLILQATDLNITQGEQRAQQAAARAAAPQQAPSQPGPAPAPAQPAASAPEQAAPSIEAVEPSPAAPELPETATAETPTAETETVAVEPETAPAESVAPEAVAAESTVEPEPEPVASAPAAETQE